MDFMVTVPTTQMGDKVRSKYRPYEFRLTPDIQKKSYKETSGAHIWHGLKEGTSAHGIPHINKAKGAIKKSFWSVISIIILGTMIYHLYSLLNNYFLYRVNVQIEMVQNQKLRFPAVTVCNMNAIKESNLHLSQELSDLLSDSSNRRLKRAAPDGQNNENLNEVPQGNLISTSNREKRSNTPYNEEKAQIINKSRKKRSTDSLILYDNLDKTGSQTVITASGDMDSFWLDRASSLTVTGPSYWTLYREPGYTSEWFTFCPGDYFGGTDFIDNTLESMKIMTGPLCTHIPTYPDTTYTVDDSTSCWQVDYTCSSNMVFLDGSTVQTIQCIGGQSLINGSWSGTVLGCADALIMYDNVDKSGDMTVVTSSGDMESAWLDKASSLTVTGPSYWTLYREPGFTSDWFTFCPGDYFGGTDFIDNTLESMKIMTGPLCTHVPTYPDTTYTVDNSTSCWQVNYTCNSNMVFNDGSSLQTIQCTGGQSLINGSWSGTVLGCMELDALIMYDNLDKTGDMTVVTYSGDMESAWLDKASSLTVTGPSYWTLYREPGYSSDWFTFCPGDYFGGTDFVDNTLESMKIMTGPLCTHVPTYPDTTYTVDNSTSCWLVNYTCNSNMVFNDGSTVQTIQCIGGQSLINGSWSGTVLGCIELDALIMYDNVDKTGDMTVVTYSGDMESAWLDRASSLTVTGPSYWTLYREPGYSSDWFTFCPGDYFGGTDFVDNTLESMKIMTGPLCTHIPTYPDTTYTVDNTTSCWQVNYTCNFNMVFNDGSILQTIQCIGGQSLVNGSWSDTVLGCVELDSLILYDNLDKTGSRTVITASGDMDSFWLDRASSLTVTGPSYWTLYREPGYSSDWFTLCPGDYFGGTDFVDNTLESMKIMSTPLCIHVPSYPDTVQDIDNSTLCWTVNYTCVSEMYFEDGSFSNLLQCKGGQSLANGTWVGTVPHCVGPTTTDSVETTTLEETTTQTTECICPTTVESTTVPPSVSSVTQNSYVINNTEYREDFVLQETVTEVLAGMDEDKKVSLGYGADEMIVDCAYQGYQCNTASHFSSFFHPNLGNCYTFNSGWSDEEALYSYRTGQRYGLGLVVNINQSEYITQLTDAAGARVIIHTQEIMPHPMDEGVLARPGEITSIGIRRLDIDRKPHPYGDCTQEYEHDLRDVYAEIYPVEYSNMGCRKTCYQKNVIALCGCGDPSYPLSGQSLGDAYPACDINNEAEENCRQEVEDQFKDGQITCDCKQRCSESHFISDVSTAKWPANKHVDLVIENLMEINPNFVVNDSFNAGNNLLRVEVYFAEFNYERIWEKPAYLDSQLMSDFGGAVGLWFGLSILSFFEFIEFFMDLLVLGCIKCCMCKRLEHNETTPIQDIRNQSVVARDRDQQVQSTEDEPHVRPPSYNTAVRTSKPADQPNKRRLPSNHPGPNHLHFV